MFKMGGVRFGLVLNISMSSVFSLDGRMDRACVSGAVDSDLIPVDSNQ